EGYKKTQLKLLLFAACLPSSLVISFVVLGERFYSYGFTAQFNSLIFQLRTYADLSVSLFVLFTTYAMIKYRLFGVKVIISKLVYWIISSFMIFSLFYSVVLTELRYFDNLLAPQVVVLNVLLAIVITLFLQWFLQTLKRVINHLLTKYSYDPDAVYDSFVNEIGKTRTHSHVLETLFNTVSQTFAPNKQAAFIALTSDQNEQILTQWQNFTDNDIYHFEHEETINALLDYASRHDTFLIQQLIDAHSEENITKILSEMEIEVCIPFKSSALDGLLLIGKKHNRDGYTQEDLVLIEKLVYYASLNIERTL
ncbi:hypothetical protein KC571_02640, partial [candidate division WWE3 bacterium]|nr:hypothetical protein [candidate division WWE3 bacterium]